jgi:transcriptional regulator with XRE-family HTH domain
MKSSAAMAGLPVAVRRELTRLGRDLSAARRRRRLTTALVAERAFVSRNTITRVERGDAGVSIGIYATVLFVLGMAGRLGAVAASNEDEIGLGLEIERLPKRVRAARHEPLR